MAKHGSAQTLTEHYTQVLRQSIGRGDFAPGERLAPAALAHHFGTSNTVIRGALTQLTGGGMVVSKPNAGFFVREHSMADLEDITLVRKHSDSLALRLAIRRGDLDWEKSVLGAHHSLARIPRREPEPPYHLTEDWTNAHRAYHLALLQACGIPLLLETAAALFDAVELYRRWTAQREPGTVRDTAAEHQEVVDAVLARDEEAAVAALVNHYEGSVQQFGRHGLAASAASTHDVAPGARAHG